MTRRRVQLDKADPFGRLDVAAYRLAKRACEKLEREHGVIGLQQFLMPILEEAILMHVPQVIILPREFAAVVQFIEANRTGNIGGGGRTN